MPRIDGYAETQSPSGQDLLVIMQGEQTRSLKLSALVQMVATQLQPLMPAIPGITADDGTSMPTDDLGQTISAG